MLRPPRRLRRLLVSLPAALVVVGCAESPPSGEPRSLVLIVIDTLRADHLGCYGYEFPTSPTLDSLAAAGTRFDQANTPVPVTLPSVSSVLTGRYPPRHGVRDNGYFVLDDEIETLAERFRAAGFRTAAAVGSDVLAPDRGLAQGFEEYDAEFSGDYPVWDDTIRLMAGPDLGEHRRRANAVTDRAIDLMRGFGRRPFFLFVHYFDVHHFYDPPPEFDRLHPDRKYDGEIAFVDREIGRLLAALRDAGSTLVVVAGDHGEGLGDHGEPEHGFLLHEATLRVPLIAAGPGVPVAFVRTDPVSLVDLEPTLGRGFDLPSDGAPRDGRALDWARPDEPVPLYGETLRTLVSYGWSELRSVRWGKWKLVRGAGDDDLFDLQADPDERHDLGTREPHAKLSAMLDEMSAGDDPEQVYAVAHGATDAQPREVLESLGYTGRTPARSPPPNRPHPRDELPRWLDRQVAKGFLMNAERLAMEERWEEAIARLDEAISWDESFGAVYALRGDCRLRLGDPDGAHADYRRAVELDSTNVGAHVLLARLALREGNGAEALAHWEAVVREDPEHREGLRVLTATYLRGREIDRALPLLRRLVALEPEDGEARYNLGVAARLTGHRHESREHLEAFLRLAPGHPQADQVRRWLEPAPGAD